MISFIILCFRTLLQVLLNEQSQNPEIKLPVIRNDISCLTWGALPFHIAFVIDSSLHK